MEDDLVWFVPFTIQKTAQKGFGEIVDFVFHMKDEWGIPSLNFFMYLFVRLFGLRVEYYSLALLALHCLNSLLLFLLLYRGMKMSPKASFFASLIFLTYYAHFHAYVWPIAVQHLVVIFFALLVLWLYLETEERFKTHNAPRRWYWITLSAAFISSFCRISVLIVPCCVLADILLEIKNSNNEINKYWRWFPLLIIYCFYPSFDLAYGASGLILEGFIPNLSSSQHPVLVGSLLFLAAVFLFLFLGWGLRYLLSIPGRFSSQKHSSWIVVFGFLLGLVAFLGLFPFTQAFALLLTPWKSFQYDRTFYRWHPLGVSSISPLNVALVLMALICFMAFIYMAWRSKPKLLIFAAWYYFTVPFLIWPVHALPSRYYIYLSPVVAVVIIVVFFEGAIGFLSSDYQRQLYARAFTLFMLGLVIANLYAINRNLSITRLSDSYWSYDFIRTAELIKEDLQRKHKKPALPDTIYVENFPFIIVPPYRVHCIQKAWDIFEYHPLKYILGASLGLDYNKLINIEFNRGTLTGNPWYQISGFDICNQQGNPIDIFSLNYREGIKLLNQKRYFESLKRIRQATARKPFLIRYSVGDRSIEEYYKENGNRQLTTILELAYRERPINVYPKFYYINDLMKEELYRYGQALIIQWYLEDRLAQSTDSTDYYQLLDCLFPRDEILKPDFWLSAEELLGTEEIVEKQEILAFTQHYFSPAGRFCQSTKGR